MRHLLIVLLLLGVSITAGASESRMVGLGEDGATGSFLFADYRNLYRNPSEDVGSFAVVEFGAKEAGVFFEVDESLLPQIGVMMGHDNGVDVFAANDLLGARVSAKRAGGDILLGVGLGFTMNEYTVYGNWSEMSGDDAWNAGGSYTFEKYVLFGQYTDVGADDDWSLGLGRVWELMPEMLLKGSLVFTDDTGVTAGIGLEYMVTSKVGVFGSAVQSLKEATDTKVNLGVSARHNQFLVEGLLGTSALLDTDEMFTTTSISLFF